MRRVWRTAAGVAVGVGLLVGCGSATEPARSAAAPTVSTAPATAPATATAKAATGTLDPAELQGRWWSWAATEPERTNPVADRNGRLCDRNQPRDVWFLAGTFGGFAKRACVVPEGRPIAFPVVNYSGTKVDCADFMKDARGSVILDGRSVEPERRAADAIRVRSARGNAVTGEAGRLNTTGCGLWVQLPPLPSGTHTLYVLGAARDFSTGVLYTLTVPAA